MINRQIHLDEDTLARIKKFGDNHGCASDSAAMRVLICTALKWLEMVDDAVKTPFIEKGKSDGK